MTHFYYHHSLKMSLCLVLYVGKLAINLTPTGKAVGKGSPTKHCSSQVLNSPTSLFQLHCHFLTESKIFLQKAHLVEGHDHRWKVS